MLPVLGFFTVIANTLRTVLFNTTMWATIFGYSIFTFFTQNGLKLVKVVGMSTLVYAAQDIVMGYFGQISPQLQIVLTNMGVPEGIAIIFAGYIWRFVRSDKQEVKLKA